MSIEIEPTLEQEGEAAVAIIAALTHYFYQGGAEGVGDFLEGLHPSAMVSVMFGLLVAGVETYCDEMNEEPESYVQRLGLALAEHVS